MSLTGWFDRGERFLSLSSGSVENTRGLVRGISIENNSKCIEASLKTRIVQTRKPYRRRRRKIVDPTLVSRRFSK